MKARFVFEALVLKENMRDVLKPKEGALEELKKWDIKNLLNPTVDEFDVETMDEWLTNNPNLASALEYKGEEDAKNIMSFDLEQAVEDFPGSYDLFRDIIEKSGFVVDKKYPLQKPGGLNVYLGHLRDGTKMIFYKGGLIDGYAARKEWLR